MKQIIVVCLVLNSLTEYNGLKIEGINMNESSQLVS